MASEVYCRLAALAMGASVLTIFALVISVPLLVEKAAFQRKLILEKSQDFKEKSNRAWSRIVALESQWRVKRSAEVVRSTTYLHQASERVFGSAGGQDNSAASMCQSRCSSRLQCPRGPRGAFGESGDNGRTGTPGNPGDLGKDGWDVQLKPAADLPCYVCPSGPPGPKGPQGERGYKGDMGQRGLDGGRGVSGQDGASGDPGRGGPPGGKGPLGEMGPRGDTVQGGPGMKGPKGAPGPAGPKGPPGLDGRAANGNGMPGLPGRVGGKGPPGKEGSSGNVGPWGPPGTPGIPGAQCSSQCSSNGEATKPIGEKGTGLGAKSLPSSYFESKGLLDFYSLRAKG